MKHFLAWLNNQERSEKMYWLGLLLLFIGLTFWKSVFLAMTIVGATMAVESVLTSYLAGLLKSRAERESE